MAFVDQTGAQNRKTAIIGTAAINAAIGAVMIAGLSGVVITQREAPKKPTLQFPTTPPPTPEPVPEPKPDVATQAPIVTPVPPLDLTTKAPPIDTVTDIPVDTGFIAPVAGPIGDPVDVGPIITPIEPVLPDPIGAKPRNDPGGWVSERDYKSSWIRAEMTGTARFKVSVGTNGRAKDCQITGSTGHKALDNATCRLVMNRARFSPALNGAKEKVPGTYSNAIRWELPD